MAKFSSLEPSPSIHTHVTGARESQRGRRGDEETGVAKVEFESDDAVDLRILLWEPLRVDEPSVEGVRKCSIGQRK